MNDNVVIAVLDGVEYFLKPGETRSFPPPKSLKIDALVEGYAPDFELNGKALIVSAPAVARPIMSHIGSVTIGRNTGR